MPVCSPRIQKYFDSLQKEVSRLYEVAQAARAKHLDPEPFVDIPLAANVAQRVEALIASVAQQIKGAGISQRIDELEKQYGPGDWRVALTVSEEVAREKFCKFKDLREAIEIGIRIGFAYLTSGAVSAPLEGLVEIKFKKRKDGKDYIALYYAGPVRGAGGTASACSVMIADYLRKKMSIDRYDPTDEEVKRYQVEIDDYCTKVMHRQYVPTPEELEFLVRNIGVEMTGDPTEKFEVSQCKHLERVETDQIRGGLALVLTEGPSLKAEKVWKQLSKWGKEFGFEEWNWMKEFVAMKQRIHSASQKAEEVKGVVPVDSYLHDLVAGRPVFGYPMRPGGFRLRYGRSRLTGFASTAIHPATMRILKDYLATGTQVKTERPGKATVFSVCDSIDGPIVMLEDGSVKKIQTEELANKVKNKIASIIYLGDLLITYGDFSENGQKLVPAGYCEEWWEREYEQATGGKEFDHNTPITAKQAIELSGTLKLPLHPRFTYYWNQITNEQFAKLFSAIKIMQGNKMLNTEGVKPALETLGVEHDLTNNEIILQEDDATILKYLFAKETFSGNNGLECINSISPILIKDKSGTFIGTRMGRPEKAKLRKLKGTPVVLFPVGKEGGRLRSFQEALEVQSVTADFPIFECTTCNKQTLYPNCEDCGKPTEKWYVCPMCKKRTKLQKCHTNTVAFERRKINLTHYFDKALKHVNETQAPILVKGVRGTWNKDHLLENLAKGMLRAKHGLAVNKDGTIRYDMTEMGFTHFKPKEIGTSIQKLKELGYEYDKDGQPLTSENQVIELLPQDVALPSCPESDDELADNAMTRICNFIDDELEKFYGIKKYYNIRKKEDLVGQLVIGLAPHTSSGVIGRIIGFTKTQGAFAHPYWHAAQRRNFDGDETCVMLAMDAFLNFSRQYLPDIRGGRSMDAPLVLSTIIDPPELDTEVFGLDIAPKYQLEFYQAALDLKWPWEVKIEQVKSRLGKPEQYEGLKYTHEVSDMNSGVRYSAYKSIPTMVEKLTGQMELATKIRAVDLDGVAKLVIDRHFIRDIKGNLRGFTQQEFRCINCNAKYRRPPISGTCLSCKSGRLVFTIAEGSIKKYLEASMELAKLCPPYMRQSLLLLQQRIEIIFGKDLTKQVELKSWFG
jgi:DNA polymerase II large subunit